MEKLDFSCSHHFGYLNQHPGIKEIPDQCLTCKKLLECKFSKSESVEVEEEPTSQVIEAVKPSINGPPVDSARAGLKEKSELENKPSPLASSGNQYIVKKLGKLEKSWPETVFINKEILSSWGGRISEVSIQTRAKKQIRCKVMPSTDPMTRIIMVPDGIRQKLEVIEGDLVIVEPSILLVPENKTRGIINAFTHGLKLKNHRKT